MTGFRPFTLNLRGRLVSFDRPAVMAIVNATPDSFYEGSRTPGAEAVAARVEQVVNEGADIIDLGAYSSRPGADDVSTDEELKRLTAAMKALREVAPDIPVSIDTFRADVARRCIEELGADIINDISGGTLDPAMFETVAELRVPYILMHMRGTPATMGNLTDYPRGVVTEVIDNLSRIIDRLRLMGVSDIIADPGLGFAKTVSQNYELLAAVPAMTELIETPVLIGLSRKSMLFKPLGITPGEALEATVAADTLALAGGASIIRVHDVKAGVETREIVSLTLRAGTENKQTTK